MGGLLRRLTAALERLRTRYQWLDHLLRMVAHYGLVNGNGQAGGVTFFGFLSFFPILALAFFVVGRVAQVFPEIRGQIVTEIGKLLPGVIGSGQGEIPLSTIESYAGRVGIVGLVLVVYSGLGWLSATRQALEVMFAVPRKEQPNFALGKLRDLGTLVLIGLVLLVSVALSGAVTSFSDLILGWLGVDPEATAPKVFLSLVGHALAIAASAVLLLTMFNLLVVDSHVPRSSQVSGAVLGAVGFEVLKLGANLLLAQTKGQPAFQAFGVALILLVWINYFSRLVMVSAAWAYTAPASLSMRTAEAMRAPGAVLATEAVPASSPGSGRSRWLLAAGAAAVGAVAATVVRGVRR